MLRQITKYIYETKDITLTLRQEPLYDEVHVVKHNNSIYALYLNKDVEDHFLNPRKDDNLGRIIYFHKKYSIGDEHNYDPKDYSSRSKLEEAVLEGENAVAYLPIYLYDHSNIAVSTTPFSSSWDSGRVGLILISEEELEKEGISKEKAKNILKDEVEEYNFWVSGESYQIIVEKFDSNKDYIDSSSIGVLGYSNATNELQRLMLNPATISDYFALLQNKKGD